MSARNYPLLLSLCLLLAACSRAHSGREHREPADESTHEGDQPATTPESDARASRPTRDPGNEDDEDTRDDSVQEGDAEARADATRDASSDAAEPFDPANFALRDPEVPGYHPLTTTLPPPGFETAPCAALARPLLSRPLHLAFVFDVSASMGKGDTMWNDRMLKWEPVVLAARSFFSAESSRGLTSSLSFFPGQETPAESCMSRVYQLPAVGMSELPTTGFDEAFRLATPNAMNDWRAGVTPAAAIEGTAHFLAQESMRSQGGFAIVLVTNGDYPETCQQNANGNRSALAMARELGFPTYVIAIENPPIANAPDAMQALDNLALAGGTEHAHAVRTGNQMETLSDFARAISAIREHLTSCRLSAPMGFGHIVRNTARVRSQLGDVATTLKYDRACGPAGGWHFVDPKVASEVELCPETCNSLQAQRNAQLRLEYPCAYTLAD